MRAAVTPKAIPVSALSATRNWTHGSELSGLTAQRKKVRQMSKKDEIFRRYEKLARAAKRENPGSASEHKPGSCAHCLYYRPDFKYRRCQFTRCPYIICWNSRNFAGLRSDPPIEFQRRASMSGWTTSCKLSRMSSRSATS